MPALRLNMLCRLVARLTHQRSHLQLVQQMFPQLSPQQNQIQTLLILPPLPQRHQSIRMRIKQRVPKLPQKNKDKDTTTNKPPIAKKRQ